MYGCVLEILFANVPNEKIYRMFEGPEFVRFRGRGN